jgi:hypothetical protein
MGVILINVGTTLINVGAILTCIKGTHLVTSQTEINSCSVLSYLYYLYTTVSTQKFFLTMAVDFSSVICLVPVKSNFLNIAVMYPDKIFRVHLLRLYLYQ